VEFVRLRKQHVLLIATLLVQVIGDIILLTRLLDIYLVLLIPKIMVLVVTLLILILVMDISQYVMTLVHFNHSFISLKTISGVIEV